MGIVGWYLADKLFPAVIAGRYYPVCYDYIVQLFITLPVEINASKRALVWLSSSGITNSYNHAQAEDALRSAAYTYVVAALGSLATLVYYIMIFMGRRD